MPMDNIADFAVGHAASDHSLVTAKVWNQVVTKLSPVGRWARAFGPLSSAIATLLDFGWTLPSISE